MYGGVNERTCRICGKTHSTLRSLCLHIAKNHSMHTREYYDKFVKSGREGLCEECGRPTKWRKFKFGYHRFCSIKCAANSESTTKKRMATCVNRYGGVAPLCSKVVRDKMEATCLKIFGTRYPSSTKGIKEKVRRTYVRKYGCTSFTKTAEYREKTKQTSLNRYGCESPNQNPEVKDRQRQGCIDKYGVDFATKLESVRKRTAATCIKRYGVEAPMQSDFFKQKAMETSIRKYGVPAPMMCRDVMLKTKRKFRANGKVYDSSWEYGFELYLRKHGIKYIYQPDVDIRYRFNGTNHRYYPDFAIVNDVGDIIELIDTKGDHLLKQMRKSGTKENSKLECMKQNNVKILNKSDLVGLGILTNGGRLAITEDGDVAVQ